jgi:hypothetical protein
MRQGKPGARGTFAWRDLLQAGTGLSLAEVAAHGGFSDQSQFCHHFKRIVGVTPGQFQTTKVDVTNGTRSRASLSQPTHGPGPCTRESCSAGLGSVRPGPDNGPRRRSVTWQSRCARASAVRPWTEGAADSNGHGWEGTATKKGIAKVCTQACTDPGNLTMARLLLLKHQSP